MAQPIPRADLVKAVADAQSIVEEGIPLPWDGSIEESRRRQIVACRTAALPVILRELLDVVD